MKNLFNPSVCGVGFIGVGGHVSNVKRKHTKAYSTWRGMLNRCYGKNQNKFNPTYKGCTVCESWHNFNVFADWFYENWIVGCHLDKDIKVKGSKIYSPSTCSFVSPASNTIEASAKNYKFISPLGVITEIYNLNSFCKKNNLDQGNMANVSLGKLKHHKGWKVHEN